VSVARLRPVAWVAVAAVLVAGCRRAAIEETAPSDGTPTTAAAGGPAPSDVPSDHLAPGELVEGSEVAFGLKLPREVHIERAQAGSVRAIGPVSAHALVRYFRPRISEGHREEGDTYAAFTDVRLGAKPGGVFRIRMTELPGKGTLLEIDDVTPPPAPDLPNEAARWRQVGLTPNGRVLDPTHLD
jgi:hypothetical protein